MISNLQTMADGDFVSEGISATVTRAEVRSTKAGKKFWSLMLKDGDASISATIWNTEDRSPDLGILAFEVDSRYLFAPGGKNGSIRVKEYNGEKGLNINPNVDVSNPLNGNGSDSFQEAPHPAERQQAFPQPAPPLFPAITPGAAVIAQTPIQQTGNPDIDKMIKEIADQCAISRTNVCGGQVDITEALNTSLEWIDSIKTVSEMMVYEKNSNVEKSNAAVQIYNAVFTCVYGNRLIEVIKNG